MITNLAGANKSNFGIGNAIAIESRQPKGIIHFIFFHRLGILYYVHLTFKNVHRIIIRIMIII